jgi:hypothetical protein
MGVVDPCRSIVIVLGSILFVDVILCFADIDRMETISDELDKQRLMTLRLTQGNVGNLEI